MSIETARLLLRPPRLADVPALYAFLGDRKAMRLTHVDESLRGCQRRIAVHERCRRRDGVAPWAVLTRDARRIVGWGGLYQDPFTPGWGVEVGYSFHPEAWGQGYASELVAASLDIGDRVLALPAVSAFTHPDNAASRRILEKAGFTVERLVPEMGRMLYHRERRDGARPTS